MKKESKQPMKTICVRAQQARAYQQEVQVTEEEYTLLQQALASGKTLTLQDHPTAFLILQEKLDMGTLEEVFTDVTIQEK